MGTMFLIGYIFDRIHFHLYYMYMVSILFVLDLSKV